MATAILIDGEFFLRRYFQLRGEKPPQDVARDLHWMCRLHLRKDGDPRRTLYRIFFYDCPPLKKKVHNPISHKIIDFSKTKAAQWRDSFHNELRKQRKLALRFGALSERRGDWKIRPVQLKRLLKHEISFDDLSEQDVQYDVQQKGVDMRIGLDIASLAYKRQVDQIVLVSGDSDFVPAAKMARREGIDFILDPMWASIRSDLHEHIDGLRSVFGKQGDRAIARNEPPSTNGINEHNEW